MSKTCSECGVALSGSETACPNCGNPLRSSYNAPSVAFEDEGDNNAENILRKVLNFLKVFIIIFSILIGLAGLVWGCVMLSNPYGGAIGLIPIVVGILIILLGIGIARLVWATGMIFINISTNVRTMKQMLKNKL